MNRLTQTAPLPAVRNLEGDFGGGDFWEGLFGAEFLGGDEAGFFGLDAVEELARGFHVRVGGAPVGGQLAVYRKAQDVTAQQVRFGGQSVPAMIRESGRDALINGRWDAIGELIEGLPAVKATATTLPYLAA